MNALTSRPYCQAMAWVEGLLTAHGRDTCQLDYWGIKSKLAGKRTLVLRGSFVGVVVFYRGKKNNR